MTPATASIKDQLAFEEDLLAEFGDLFAHLTEEGHEAFIRELMAAIKQSCSTNTLQPFREVIEAWYRTMLIRSSDDYDQKMAHAVRSRPRRRYTAEEIRTRLGR